MAEIALKEGQIYLLDGNVLVEAAFNDATGFWQLHEPEDRSSWMVSPNGKLMGMQFDAARGKWLLDPEPDVWSTEDLQRADANTPKLPNLLRQAERIAAEKHGGHLTVMRLSTGWKAMYGDLDIGNAKSQEKVQKLKTFKSLYEAIQSLL